MHVLLSWRKMFSASFFLFVLLTSIQLVSSQTAGCGPTNLTAEAGTEKIILSPNFPSNYGASQDCWWIIKPPDDHIIELSVKKFKTEFCCDKLKIYDSFDSSTDRNLIETLAGTVQDGRTISSLQAFVALNFKSDSSVHFSGFNITYTAKLLAATQILQNEIPTATSPPQQTTTRSRRTGGECRADVIAESTAKLINPPGHPGLYRSNLDCDWLIIPQDGERVQISIGLIATQICCDIIEVFEGEELLARLSGRVLNVQRFVSSRPDSPIRITFKTDESVNRAGFRMVHRSVSGIGQVQPLSLHAVCGGNLIASRRIQQVTSPNWPSPYPESVQCEWTITSSLTQLSVEIVVDRLNTQECCDFLEIHGDGFQVARLSGSAFRRRFVMNDNGRIVFTANSTNPGTGFRITYRQVARQIITTTPRSTAAATQVAVTTVSTTVQPITTCRESRLNAHSGRPTPIIISRSIGVSESSNCWWTIIAPTSQFVRVIFTKFQLDACCDSVIAYNSRTQGHVESLIIQEFNGNEQIPQAVFSERDYLTLFLHIDTLNVFRGFEAHFDAVESRCGFDYKISESRVNDLNSPNYPDNYPSSTECEWKISTEPGRVVQFTVGEFSTEPCCDYLEIFDGGRAVEKLRGTSSDNQYVSTDHTGFTLRFSSDKSVERKGFRGVYSSSPADAVTPLTVPSDCGFETMATTAPQNVTSPGWEENVYEMNLDCYWTISVSTPGYQVFFSVVEGRTETCCDYVQVFNNDIGSDTLSGHFTSPVMFVSTNGSLRILFHSDATQAFRGFRGLYYEGPTPTTPPSAISLSASTASCGVVASVKNISQHFTSPNYPESYSGNAICEWTLISNDPDVLVRLTFTNFHTEPCCDTVTILEGLDEVDVLRGTISSPAEYISKGNNFTVRFQSDLSDHRRGFNASFIGISRYDVETTTAPLSATRPSGQDCGYEIAAFETPHEFISPGWPDRYPSSSNCNWMISAPIGWTLVLNFTSFDTEQCCDILNISDSTGNLATLSGLMTSDLPSIVTSQNELSLSFVSDKNIRKDGFTALYSAIPPPTTTPATTTPAYVCEETLNITQNTQVITSEGFPHYYASSTNCTWTLVAAEGERMLLNFTTISLETCCDYIEIFDGIDDKVLEKISFENLPTNQIYVSSGHVMRFRFISDINIEEDGFQVQVQTIQGLPAYNCDARIFIPSTPIKLTSTNYPNNYTTSVTCNWNLETSSGRRVVVNFTDFQMESCCDYVEIFDGDDRRLVAKLDMHTFKYSKIFESTSSQMSVSFYSDKTITGRGFKADVFSTSDEYVVDPGACGFTGVASNTSTYFHSPNYPMEYPAKSECHWLIASSSPLEQVELNLHDIRFEDQSDYLEVRDGRSPSAPLLGVIQRDFSQQAVFSSTTGAMYIKMRTDTSNQYRGFNASYKLVPTERSCGSTLHALDFPTQIRTSNASGTYPNGENCMWTLKADEGKIIVLNFTFMEMEICCDKVQIFDGQSERFIDNITFFGLTSPLVYNSSSNVMKVRFISDDTIGAAGFVANFVQEPAPDAPDRHACGFTWNATSQPVEFNSPLFPLNYPFNAECHWLIRSPDKNKQVQLEILDFRTEKCCDFLKVYDGTSTSAPLITSLSDVIEPGSDVITSTSGSLYLEFVSDASGSYRGFLATFKMVEVERKYSNSCYSIMKAFTDKTPVVEVKEVTSCSPKHQCLTVKTVADAQVKMNGDSFEATVTYGACIPSIACPVTSCSDLMTSLRGIDLPFTMNFTTCEVECCDEDLCNDDQPPPTTATPTTLPTTTALPLTTDEYGCWNQRRDVMFLLDGSGSFTALEFMEILKFVNQLVEGFDLELTRVGVMQFSHWYRHRPMTTRAQTLLKTHIYLGQYSDADQLQAAISGINHHGYTTYIAHAIEKAISIDFPRAGRFSDSCTSKIIVVVSDGKATDANYLPTTTGLGRALGFNFFAVGIGDREMRELQIIANGKVGSDERLFVVPWADQLTTVARQLSAEILM